MTVEPRIFRNVLYAPTRHAGVSLLDISFRGAPFARHSHAGFAIGAIEAGVGGYRARGARQLFPSGTLSLLNPEESHNGFALEAGVSYKMLYIDKAALTGVLDHHRRLGFTDDIPTDPDGWLLSRLRLLRSQTLQKAIFKTAAVIMAIAALGMLTDAF